MTAWVRRATLACVALAALGGCAQIRDHKGYVVDSSLINTVQPGIDNRESVDKTLGGPSFKSEFDGGATYYYLSRDTRAYAFSQPHPVKQLLLTVRFASNGEVSSVQRTGLETIRKITPYGRTTPTLGRHRGFFTELFGNVGVGGRASTGPSTDNPDG